MRNFLIINLYIFFAFGILSFVDPEIFNFNFITLLKYIDSIALASIIIIYAYIKSIKIKNNLLTTLIFIMLLIILIPGVLFSVEEDISLFRGILALSIFIIIFGSVGILGSQEALKHTYKFLFIVAVFTILLTDAMWLTGDMRAFYMENLKSFFQNANVFGTFVGLFFLPTLLLKIFENKGRKKSYIFIFFFINLLILFWFIRSRSALLSFAVFSMFIIYYKHYRWSKKRTKNLVLILFSLSIFGIVISSNEKVQSYLEAYFVKYEFLQDRADYSIVTTRSQLWLERIQGIEKRPLVGWGYGVNSMDYDKDYSRQHGITEKGNSALAILEEFGLIFGILLIFIIGLIVFRLFKKIKRSDVGNTDLLLVTSSLLVAALIHVNFESWLLYFGNPSSFLFWLLLVAMISLPTESNSKRVYT
jgi:O-antigen ligase